MHIPSQGVPTAPCHGAMQPVNKQGGAMSVATAVPGKGDEKEIYPCAETELVNCYKVYICMMAVLQQGPRQEMTR